MKREILCPSCAEEYRLHPADKMIGFKMRRVEIQSVKVPPGHGIKVNGAFHAMAAIKCDHCDAIVNDKSPAVAFTTWNTNREGTPGDWEREYSA